MIVQMLMHKASNAAAAGLAVNVLDLYTGQLLGQYNNTILPSYGQIYMYNSPNQHGAYSMLWRSVTTGASTVWGTGNGTVLEMLDGYTLPLKHICYIANTSASGTNVVGNNGELLWYSLVNSTLTQANPQYRLTCWNNTNVIGETATAPNTGTTYWQWRPEGGGFGGGPAFSNSLVFDGKTGFSFNVSIPLPYRTTNSILTKQAQSWLFALAKTTLQAQDFQIMLADTSSSEPQDKTTNKAQFKDSYGVLV